MYGVEQEFTTHTQYGTRVYYTCTVRNKSLLHIHSTEQEFTTHTQYRHTGYACSAFGNAEYEETACIMYEVTMHNVRGDYDASPVSGQAHTHTHTHTHPHVYICIYIYIHTHTHT